MYAAIISAVCESAAEAVVVMSVCVCVYFVCE